MNTPGRNRVPPVAGPGGHRYHPTGRRHAVAPFFLGATLYFLIVGPLMLARLVQPPGLLDLAGWYWPLAHLLFVGGVTQLIMGAMAFFAVTLLRTEAPPAWLTRGQWLLVNLGALGLAGGALTARPPLSVVGGGAVLAALGLLLATLIVLRRRALIAPDTTFLYYLAAIGCLLVGATLGLLMVSGWFAWLPLAYGPLRLAHLHLNINGWVTLTIIGTMRFFFPTTLGRPARHLNPAWLEFWPLATGVALTTLGWLSGVSGLVGLGFVCQFVGTVAYTVAVVRQWRAAPAGPPALAASHLLAATGWLAALTLGGVAAVLVRPLDAGLATAGLRAVSAAAFVGFIGQTILGGWTHLVAVVAALQVDPVPPRAAPFLPRLRAILNQHGRWQVAAANLGAAGIVLGEILSPLAPAAAGWATGAGLASLAGLLGLVAVKAVRVVVAVVRTRGRLR